MKVEFSPDRARRELAEVASGLTAYLADSEQTFLTTMEQLDSLRGRVGRLVAASHSAAAAAAPDEGDDPLVRLAEGLAGLRRSITEGAAMHAEGARGLGEVRRGLDALHGFRGELQNVSISLWALSVSTRMEDARNTSGQGSFETVVADVRRLGGQIQPRYEALLAGATRVRDMASRAAATHESFRQRDAGELLQSLTAASTSVGSLSSLRASASAVSARAEQASASLADDVLAVATATQSHDIARQMIEHAHAELLGLHEGGSAAEVEALARLQASQVQHARRTLDEGLRTMAAHLRHLGAGSLDLSHRTTGAQGLGDGTSALGQVERGVGRARAVLEAQLRGGNETTDVMRRVASTMSELARHALDIERIAAEVKLLALNAQVQAEKAGERGRALAVLARGIRELSLDVERQTEHVGLHMERITGQARALDSAEHARAAERGSTEALMRDLDAATSGLGSRQAQMADALGAVSREASAVSAEVGQLSARLTADAEATRALEHLEHDLTRLADAAHTAADPREAAAVATRLHAAASRYTMARQREIHAVAVGKPASHPAAPRRPEGGEMGSNVELF